MKKLLTACLIIGLCVVAHGQAALAPVGKQQFFDASGRPLSGGKVYTYVAGTTTPLATYTDSTMATENSNPIVLDSGGFAAIWLNPAQSYKVIVKSVLGVTISSTDNVSAAVGGPTGAELNVPNTWTALQTLSAGVTGLPIPTRDTDATTKAYVDGNTPNGVATVGVVKKKIAALNSNVIYAAGTTTYSSGTYTALAGVQPLPATLTAGQIYFVNFPSTNPSAASLTVATIGTKAIKVLNSSGTALTLTGGEIAPGPSYVYYDGTQFIYETAGYYVQNVQTTIGITAVPANSCTTPATTVTMSGVTTLNTFTFTATTDTSGVTGWGSTGGLVIRSWPTANTVNFKVCNQTGTSITPGGSVTFNVSAR